jgi:hypothetical protein
MPLSRRPICLFRPRHYTNEPFLGLRKSRKQIAQNQTESRLKGVFAEIIFLSCRAQSRHLLLLVILNERFLDFARNDNVG